MLGLLFRPRLLSLRLLGSSPHLSPRFHPRNCPRFMSTVVDPVSEWKVVEKPGSVSYRVFTKAIVKSEQDDRDYRIIKLENGLEATLIHDAKADKAAASLDVAVGHLYDPVRRLRCSPCVRRSEWTSG